MKLSAVLTVVVVVVVVTRSAPPLRNIFNLKRAPLLSSSFSRHRAFEFAGENKKKIGGA